MTQGMLCISKDIIYTYSEPSRCFLTVSIAPFVKNCNDYCIFKLFVMKGSGQNFQNYGSGISELRSQISEQNGMLIGSIISELEKLVFAIGLKKRG